ncbi:MAG TPA: SH3 domain-containing protein [Terriglobia bacterium]|nr:SH3 domain-containing protein [Terriglobia bacterium]
MLSPSLDVLDSRAQVHRTIGVLKAGDRVGIIQQAGEWARIRLSTGEEGWVLAKELLDSSTHEKGQALLKQLSSEQVQAAGHAAGAVKIHLEPSREAPDLGILTLGEKLQVFNRRMVEKPGPSNPAGQPVPTAPAREAWYLVRADSRAGWLLGRLVSLDAPPAISQYAENYNMVAWFVLNTVVDGDQKVPQYLVADRVGSQEFDFTHIRVFTWWVKRHHYVTAYVESNLQGQFPIQVEQIDNVPYFRLRLADKKGNKFQKVYKLSNTIVRPVGTVEGWESDAMPQPVHRRIGR